jgi:hypothetical protein
MSLICSFCGRVLETSDIVEDEGIAALETCRYAVLDLSSGEAMMCEHCYALQSFTAFSVKEQQEIHLQFAYEYRDLGDDRRFESSLIAAQACGEHAEVFCAQATLAVSRGQIEEAKRLFTIALDIDHDCELAQRNLNLLHGVEGKP